MCLDIILADFPPIKNIWKQNISKQKVSGTKCIVPNKELIDEFDKIVSALWDLKENLLRVISVLENVRDLLLPKLISGEIDIADCDISL